MKTGNAYRIYLHSIVIYHTNVSAVSANSQETECSGQATLNFVLHNLRHELHGCLQSQILQNLFWVMIS